METIKLFLKSKSFFTELVSKNENLLHSYTVYLVDHTRESSSTHKFWWNHFEDACTLLGIPVIRLEKDFSNFTILNSNNKKRKRIFFYFTATSHVQTNHITENDIICAFDASLLDLFPNNKTYFIGFRGDTWMKRNSTSVGNRKIIFWDPFAPVHLLKYLFLPHITKKPTYDFGFWGTLNQHNYDEFKSILIPLYKKYTCIYRGLSWPKLKIPFIRSLFYGFSPWLVNDEVGIQLFLDSKIHLVIHNDYHRRDAVLTERLFYSTILGKPVVCDNRAALLYFPKENIIISPQEQVVTEKSAKQFLEMCSMCLENLDTHTNAAKSNQEKTLEQYTYLNTVVNMLSQIHSFRP